MSYTLNDAVLTLIQELAAKKTHYEASEGDCYGYSPGDNGNFDDARSDGIEDGEIRLARKLLEMFAAAPPAPNAGKE